MCGVLGLTGKDISLGFAANYLQLLSHRGQDASGLGWITENGDIKIAKTQGLPKNLAIPETFKSRAIIGSTRYPTFGSRTGEFRIEAYSQPFGYSKLPRFVIAHNGNITNVPYRKEKPYESDAEYIAEVLGQALVETEKLDKAVEVVMDTLDGAYAISGIYNGFLFAFRDPRGLRPLRFGFSENLRGFSSESYVLEAMGIFEHDDVAPGELIIMDVSDE